MSEHRLREPAQKNGAWCMSEGCKNWTGHLTGICASCRTTTCTGCGYIKVEKHPIKEKEVVCKDCKKKLKAQNV